MSDAFYAPVATVALKEGDHVLGMDGSEATITSVSTEPEQALAFHPVAGPILVDTYDVRLHVDSGPQEGEEQGGATPADAVWMVRTVATDEEIIRELLNDEFDEKDR